MWTSHDGTPLWGQTGTRTGTHDWERVEFTIYPEKPVRTLSLHAGARAWRHGVFDDLSVGGGGNAAFLFQGADAGAVARSAGAATAVEHATGMVCAWVSTDPSTIRNARRAAARGRVSGATWRQSLTCCRLRTTHARASLQIQTKVEARADHIAIEGELRDTRGQDRAILLVLRCRSRPPLPCTTISTAAGGSPGPWSTR
jgi:hypothetical protein